MRCLLLGSGGRESALASALARSAEIDELVAAPGNPGVARVARLETVDIGNPAAVVDLARKIDAGLVVIGPEAPLVAGISDALRADGRRVFGPDSAAARLEGSKAYAKQMMDGAGIPTAAWRAFEEFAAADAYLDELGPPYVIKADGLAAGKGVVVTEDRAVARRALKDRLVEGTFGDAGRRVVIEEFLDGEEASLIAFTDGRAVVPCEPAQDYKRVYDDDEGPNTGGMGSYSPVPSCPPALADQIAAEVLRPMVRAMADANAPFTGALYAGLALTSKGPRVVEFNARFGDPETQALLPRLSSDLGAVCLACATGELEGTTLQWTDHACVAVVLASAGYPGAHETGHVITGLDEAAAMPGVEIFHAGTSGTDGVITTAGGRVLTISALGGSFRSARALAYDAASRIGFEGKHVRSDIALRAESAQESRV